MRFDLQPWDRNRPRRNPPLADAVVSHGDKTFGIRAQNGILFFRDAKEDGKTWAIGSPLPGEIEREVAAYEAFWAREYAKGNVARVVVPLVSFNYSNGRQIPLLLRPNGTGFARESWNRDDIPFSHDVSMHVWLEASDEALIGELGDVQEQVKAALSVLEFPWDNSAGYSSGTDEIEWACGSVEGLTEVVKWAFALETALWAGDNISAVEVSISSESEFGRAGLRSLEFRCCDGKTRALRFETDATSDEVKVWGDELFVLSGRFWRLLDLALDCNTPMGVSSWAYTDEGAGRCADEPWPHGVSFSCVRPTIQAETMASARVREWLRPLAPASEREEILSDDAPRELPHHQW